MTQPPALLTTGDVVERVAKAGIDVTYETVRSWARTGKIARVRTPSGRFYFRAEDVDAFLTAKTGAA